MLFVTNIDLVDALLLLFPEPIFNTFSYISTKEDLFVVTVNKDNASLDLQSPQVELILYTFCSSEDKTPSTLDNFFKENKISSVDLIKIDTEGYEYFVLKGLVENFYKVKFIIFEHHYDNMLVKNYTFLNINELLKKNNFVKIYKSKMPFRKTFEYIYANQSKT